IYLPCSSIKLNRLPRIDMVSLSIAFSLLITTTIISSSQASTIIKGTKYVNQIVNNHDKQESFTGTDQHLKLETSKFEANHTTISESDPPTSLDSNQSFVLGNRSILGSFVLSSILHDPLGSCNSDFTCISNYSTGWKDKTSFEVSTNNTKNKWSSIIGQELDVRPGERYRLVTHMKMNQWATQSYVVLEGSNAISKTWHKIEQCPSGSNGGIIGPIEWKEFSCVISIEENTTKIRPILNAGWSSEPNKQATTWFDLIYMTKFKPFLTDPNLSTQIVYQGLEGPVGMAFLGPNDFLVIEVNGTVQRIVNGTELKKPVLDLQRPYITLLGIATSTAQIHTTNKSTYVFLYFNSYKKENDLNQGKEDVSNRLYRYELVNDTLVNPKLLLDLPAGFDHDGGPILIRPDKQDVYLSVGDTENETYQVPSSKALNDNTGADPDGIAGILRVTQD